jgi:DNA polymerase I-like protein with 3'-5' exonuclease and polymerase domains
MLNISQKDAKLYIEKFFENYPKVKTFFESIIKKTEET